MVGEPLLRILAFAELVPPVRRPAANEFTTKPLNSFAPRWPSNRRLGRAQQVVKTSVNGKSATKRLLLVLRHFTL